MVEMSEGSTSQVTGPRGVLIQEIPGVKVLQSFQGDPDVELAQGSLRVLLVTVNVDNPFDDPKVAPKEKGKADVATDIWVVLEIESGFSLPIKASQRVVPERSSSSYVLPSSDLPGASIRLQLLSKEKSDVEFFEEILSEYCAFHDDATGKGTIELLDDHGDLLGTIDGPWQLKEDPKMRVAGHEKDPVLLELPDEKTEYKADEAVTVTTVPRDESGQLSKQYKDDWLLKGADFISRTVVKGSTWAGEKMLGAADSYVNKSTPAPANDAAVQRSNTGISTTTQTSTTSSRPPITFSPRTHKAAERLNRFSGGAARVSNQTRDAILSVASGVGDQIGKKTGIQAKPRADGQPGEPPKGFRGALNRSLIAANVVLDGLLEGTDNLVRDGGQASSRVIEHRYGSEAKVISGNTASIGRSAYVIYKDINGVRRKALLKIATGTIVAKAPDGSQIVLQQQQQNDSSSIANHASGSGSHSPAPPGYDDDYKGKDIEKRPVTSSNLSNQESAQESQTHELDPNLHLYRRGARPRPQRLFSRALPFKRTISSSTSSTWDFADCEAQSFPSSPVELGAGSCENTFHKELIGKMRRKESSSSSTPLVQTLIRKRSSYAGSYERKADQGPDAVPATPGTRRGKDLISSLFPELEDCATPTRASQATPTTPHCGFLQPGLLPSFMTRSKSGLNEGHDLLANTLKRVDERVDHEGFIFSPSSDDSLNVDSSSQTFASAPCSQQSVEPTISPYRLSSQQSFSDEFRSLTDLNMSEESEEEEEETPPSSPSIVARKTIGGLKRKPLSEVKNLQAREDPSETDNESRDDSRDVTPSEVDLELSEQSCAVAKSKINKGEEAITRDLRPKRARTDEPVITSSLNLSTPQRLKRCSSEVSLSQDSALPSKKVRTLRSGTRRLFADAGENGRRQQSRFADCSQTSSSGSFAEMVNVANTLISLSTSSSSKKQSSLGKRKRAPLMKRKMDRNEGWAQAIHETEQAKQGSGPFRPFPDKIPQKLLSFPEWYRAYRVPSPLDPKCHSEIMVEVDKSTLDSSIKARSKRKIGERNPIENLLDLYTPRFVRGVGVKKEGLCPLCFEEEQTCFFKTKTSQYNYHMMYTHGILPSTLRPMDPPVAFQVVARPSSNPTDHQEMLQGKCHGCGKWIDVESRKCTPVNVPEIYWWKHAQACHRGKGHIGDPEKVFVEDEWYIMARESGL